MVSDCKENGIGVLLKKLYTAEFIEKQIMPGVEINRKLSEASVEVHFSK